MNIRRIIHAGICLLPMMAQADTIDVTTFKYAGPFEVRTPFLADSTDVNSRAFSETDVLDCAVDLGKVDEGKEIKAGAVPGSNGNALHLIGFNIDNSRFTSATITVEGLQNYQLYVDGKKMMTGYVTLQPSSHQVVIKYLSSAGKAESAKVSVDCDDDDALSIGNATTAHKYNFSDVIHGTHFTRAALSANGKFMIVGYQTTRQGGKTSQRHKVIELATGKVLSEQTSVLHWMPRTNKYYFVREGVDGRELVTADPLTGAQTIMAQNLPQGSFTMSPTETFLVFNVTSEGPKEDANVYEVIAPDDRQPGWRSRNNLAIYDLQTGVMQPLTFGHHNIILQDISADGKYLLFMKTEAHLEARPTTVFSIYKMNLQTMKCDLLIDKDGFIDAAMFSPTNASEILVMGSPECLGGIGKNVDEGQIPSMIDKQLYLYKEGVDNDKDDAANNNGSAGSKMKGATITPLTKYFNPSVTSIKWSKADGQIYFTAEDHDSLNLFRLNPRTQDIKKLKCSEELITSISLADNAPLLAYYGCSASNSDRLYTLNLKSLKEEMKEDLSSQTLKNVKLGECKAWTFVNSRGDTVYARYYLPADFDASKKYPMIVNYYGGCSPTSRYFESRYPHHAYASLGYVVLIINPSGATGFGQKWSARHVDTAGEGVAEDIIEGTKRFCSEHQFVNDKKIGCIGASYGGFMTQYLQTVTDIFAAAISHAGISDHTSYWGEGYWGYSYSEVSMANQYPWTNKHLYVDQSPLFNADKIHTPLLFLHGDADTNVPVGESIQMYTALKLLGRETAMVLVKDQDHHILDYQKRIKWQNTIFAWFAKYLQDDSTWWESMYPNKDL